MIICMLLCAAAKFTLSTESSTETSVHILFVHRCQDHYSIPIQVQDVVEDGSAREDEHRGVKKFSEGNRVVFDLSRQSRVR